MASKIQKFDENGVSVSKSTIYEGDEIVLSYCGLLAQSGADNIFAHIGYGEAWDLKDMIQMTRENDIFKATLKVVDTGSLNVAFKDCAENWDNNSLQNYSFKISKKPVKTADKSAIVKSAPAKKAAAPAKAEKTVKKDKDSVKTAKKKI